MTIKVLVVDDSTFVCKIIKRILEEDPEFSVVGFAANGQEAIVKTASLAPDVITMDVEMPIMDGINAVKRIMAECPTPVLMLSAMTQVGAKATFDALNAGAIDFLPKQLDDIDRNHENAKQQLRLRVRTVAATASVVRKRKILTSSNSMMVNSFNPPFNSVSLSLKNGVRNFTPEATKSISNSPYASPLVLSNMKLLVIVASTGGPVAIQKILVALPSRCPVPVLLIQHMPANFTRSFAERLDNVCQIRVKEAEHGDILEPGSAALAPGGMQLEIKSSSGKCRVELRPKSSSDIYAPCADITLTSIAEYFPGQSLAIILTGMGADGKEGAAMLKRGGATIWAQNEASCTIYGMPKAVIDARLADKVYDLDDIAVAFKRITS